MTVASKTPISKSPPARTGFAHIYDPRHATGLARWARQLAFWMAEQTPDPSWKEIRAKARQFAKKVSDTWVRALLERDDFVALVDEARHASVQEYNRLLMEHEVSRALRAQRKAINVAYKFAKNNGDTNPLESAKAVTAATTPVLALGKKADVVQAAAVTRIEISIKRAAANAMPELEIEALPSAVSK